jgi:hypothetical protein
MVGDHLTPNSTHSYSFHTHTISSSSSSDGIENQIAMAFSCAMEEVLAMLVEEVGGSSSTPRSKCRRHYINVIVKRLI